MVKDDTILWLGGGGVVAFMLYKSGFFKGLGKTADGIGEVAQGLGEGVQGIGGGVASAFEGVGGGLGNWGQDLGELFGPIAETQNWVAGQIEEMRLRNEREFVQEGTTDEAAFEQNKDQLVDIYGNADIYEANVDNQQRKLRADADLQATSSSSNFKSNLWKVWDAREPTSIIATTGRGVRNVWNFIRNKKTPKAAPVIETPKQPDQVVQAPTRTSNLRGGGSSSATYNFNSGKTNITSFRPSSSTTTAPTSSYSAPKTSTLRRGVSAPKSLITNTYNKVKSGVSSFLRKFRW